MCVYSMIVDHYQDKWSSPPYLEPTTVFSPTVFVPQVPSQAEIDEFYKLLERAREYDRKNNEPECELAEKKRQLTELADKLGVKIVFPEP